MSGSTISGALLKQYIERIERLEVEKAEILEQIKEEFVAAKSDGFDIKIMRHILRFRKMESADRDEQEELIEIYKNALGM